jgi:hypothetical protein
MPICERDPWRFQFFENVSCPADVNIPTDDPDCWLWYPAHRWVYDKLRIAESQAITCGPHGVAPATYPVFSKPVMNMKGMGIGSRTCTVASDLEDHYEPGHMWMELLEGEHVSTDCAVENGRVAWLRHATGEAWTDGMFKHWIVHAAVMPELAAYLGSWVGAHMAGYTGMMNFETIGGRIIEVHLRFADQWCDLNGKGWIEALVGLYATGRWRFDDGERRDGYSIPLFVNHGGTFRHPPPDLQARVRSLPSVTSLQITFHDGRDASLHPMPPGGFRVGIVNAWNLADGLKARRLLAEAFPESAFDLPD